MGTIFICVIVGIVTGVVFGYLLASFAPGYLVPGNALLGVRAGSDSPYSSMTREVGIGYGMSHGAIMGFIAGIVMIARSAYMTVNKAPEH